MTRMPGSPGRACRRRSPRPGPVTRGWPYRIWVSPTAVPRNEGPGRTAPDLRERAGSEVCDVRLLGADGLGGLLEAGQLGVGERGLDDLLHALRADLGLDAQVDAGDAVFAIHPRADRHDRA